VGDLPANVTQVKDRFPGAEGVLQSANDVTTWASPVTQTRYDKDWLSVLDLDWWGHSVNIEHPGVFPDSVAYEQRRAFRLNAYAQTR
jgi:hypothetical protein